jgi:hypothetical protein
MSLQEGAEVHVGRHVSVVNEKGLSVGEQRRGLLEATPGFEQQIVFARNLNFNAASPRQIRAEGGHRFRVVVRIHHEGTHAGGLKADQAPFQDWNAGHRDQRFRSPVGERSKS